MIRILRAGVTGPLEPYAAEFAESLLDHGFSPLSAKNQILVLAHLSRWLAQGHIPLGKVREAAIEEFLDSRRRKYTCWRSRRGLDLLVDFLRGIGAIPMFQPAVPRSFRDRVLWSYRDYLVTERACSDSAVSSRYAVAVRFSDSIKLSRSALRSLSASDVSNFLRRDAPGRCSTTCAAVGSDLRAFLRFAFIEGLTRRALAHAVPRRRRFKPTALPRAVPSTDVRRLLRSCDRKTIQGCRDFAILLLLVRLGMRAGEVKVLEVSDIDWRRGELTVHGKGKKRGVLPIPLDVGEALSAYALLRPSVHAKEFFLRVRAPHRALRTISGVLFEASRRSGLPRVGAHRLRHTAATQMLHAGAALGEIAQVLRHESLQTTALYAKVDRNALRQVVKRWPGARE